MISNVPFYSEKEKQSDLQIQEIDIQDCYPQSQIFRHQEFLEIQLWIRDSIYLNNYEAKILYRPNFHPFVYISSPVIKPSSEIHIYPDGHLCLFDPADICYRHRFSIAREIIPLLVKWVHYYEIWLENGNHWIGPETPHGSRPIFIDARGSRRA
jgi:hypothetical protein